MPKIQKERRSDMYKPYMKYGNWYIPNCNIAFPTETEAWEFLNERGEMA